MPVPPTVNVPAIVALLLPVNVVTVAAAGVLTPKAPSIAVLAVIVVPVIAAGVLPPTIPSIGPTN